MKKILLFFSIIMSAINTYGMKRQITVYERIPKKQKSSPSMIIPQQMLPDDMLNIISTMLLIFRHN